MAKIKILLPCLVALVLTVVPPYEVCAQDKSVKSVKAREIVLENLQAFNIHDVDAMLDYVAEPFLWYSIYSDTMTVEKYSHARYKSEMEGYFSSYPEVSSELVDLQVFGRFVYFTEIATWGAEGRHSQSSLGVYEVVDGKIRRVWYYR